MEEGSNANMTLFTIGNEYTFLKSNIMSKSKNSAFLGTKMHGKPLGVVVNEKLLIND
jgi:dihydroorotase